MDNKEIIALEKEVKPFLFEVHKLKIKNAGDMKDAAEMLTVVNRYLDRVTEQKETVTKPLNVALKNARELFKPIELKLGDAVETLRDAMSKYQTAEVLKQRVEEKKIIDRIGEGKGKIKLDTAVKKIEDLDIPQSEVVVNDGKVKFREDKVLKIVDLSLIPDKYFVLNDSLVLNDLKKGVTVPGATLDIKLTPLNFR